MANETKTIHMTADNINKTLADVESLKSKKINSEDINDGQVSPQKTTFFDYEESENVVDWDNLETRGWSITGATASDKYTTTDFFKIDPNTTYKLNVTPRSIYTFSKSGDFEKTPSNAENKYLQLFSSTDTFTSNEKSQWCRILFYTSDFNKSTAMMVKGDTLPSGYQPYGKKVVLKPEYYNGMTEDDVRRIAQDMLPLQKKRLTSVGSSGFALASGGQYQLTDAQKEMYGVTTDLPMTKVLQVLLGYDECNICAKGGNTASNTFFMCGLTSYILKNQVVLPSDKSSVTYNWNVDNIGTPMTENLTSLDVAKIGTFDGYVNGVKVHVSASNGTISLADNYSTDIVIPANSHIVRMPMRNDINANGVMMDGIVGSYGLLLQIGANNEGATPEEILSYYELAIKASGCKWFIALDKNGTGNTTDSGDLNNAAPLLKKKYGARFIDHRAYMRSLQALLDQGITPTTSAEYPDENGQNSNPLTETQIANGVKCDYQCIADGIYPSSFWHSAYRDGEAQSINSTHFNAQGLECWGKYMYKMITSLGLDL